MSQVALPTATPPTGEFSLSEARRIVGEFFTPNPWIYWPDFLASWTVGIACFQLVDFPQWVTADASWHWPIRIVCFIVSALLIYRCSLFIHELVHIRAGEFNSFRFVWNLLCGIPFLIPTFVYYTHLDHHRRKHYGTKEDGEYIPLARLPAWQILFYLSQIFVIPFLAIFRFGVLTPLTWISPSVRNWVHRHASSMIMDPTYIRPLPTKKTLRIIRFQEVLVFLFIWFMALRLFWAGGLLFKEPLPMSFLPHVYLTGVFIMGINALRTLGAHRWTHLGEHEMTFVEQMLDSVNYPKNPLIGGLWAPIGLRFHALHHIFPTMPYHALPEAHRRLIRDLPADSPYRQCQADSLHEVIGTLWRRARESEKIAVEPKLDTGI
ncbi:MAG: fatty acid desaturase [Bythopirellula sp.]|nr:fatty acid desaturase [Bythopirellula sp.]